jgi:hypothetical protein
VYRVILNILMILLNTKYHSELFASAVQWLGYKYWTWRWLVINRNT